MTFVIVSPAVLKLRYRYWQLSQLPWPIPKASQDEITRLWALGVIRWVRLTKMCGDSSIGIGKVLGYVVIKLGIGTKAGFAGQIPGNEK